MVSFFPNLTPLEHVCAGIVRIAEMSKRAKRKHEVEPKPQVTGIGWKFAYIRSTVFKGDVGRGTV